MLPQALTNSQHSSLSIMSCAIFLMGPTASGKTQLALELVQRFPFEIVSVDSALVYRDMDIGTAKPDLATRTQVTHHLIDLMSPEQSYSAARFRSDALAVMADITGRGRVPLLVGGTMLYFKALAEGLNDLPEADPKLRAELAERAQRLGWPALHEELARLDPATAARLKPGDAQRIQRALEVCLLTGRPMSHALRAAQPKPPYRFISIALTPSDRAVLHQRIADRFARMLREGLIEEVQMLRQRYRLQPGMPSMRCVGYRQVWQFLEGEFGSDELQQKGVVATRQLAKRQLTWLRAMAEVQTFDCLAGGMTEAVTYYLRRMLG